ncbi:hypothetical protein D3C71_2188970 [compost metagenome]
MALCNSDFMVLHLNHVAAHSGIIDKTTHVFGKDKEMVGKDYDMLDINGLIKLKA